MAGYVVRGLKRVIAFLVSVRINGIVCIVHCFSVEHYVVRCVPLSTVV